MNETFGSYLRDIRKKERMTASEVAGKSGLTTTFISQLEHNKRNPPKPETLKKIAIALSTYSGDAQSAYMNLMEKARYLDVFSKEEAE